MRSTQKPSWSDGEDIVLAAAGALEEYGQVTVQFPVGAPDAFGALVAELVFIPHSGPNKDAVYLVEYKSARDGDYLPSAAIAASRSIAEKASHEYPGTPVRLVLATDAQVGQAGARLAHGSSIGVVEGVRSGAELARGVARLAGVDLRS